MQINGSRGIHPFSKLTCSDGFTRSMHRVSTTSEAATGNGVELWVMGCWPGSTQVIGRQSSRSGCLPFFADAPTTINARARTHAHTHTLTYIHTHTFLDGQPQTLLSAAAAAAAAAEAHPRPLLPAAGMPGNGPAKPRIWHLRCWQIWHLCRPWQTDTDSRLWTCASQLEEEGVSLIHDSEQAACKYFIHAIFLKTTSGLQCLAHSLDLAALQQGAGIRRSLSFPPAQPNRTK
eukprot:1156674-Pelagomonas_calceolata.AAC.28